MGELSVNKGFMYEEVRKESGNASEELEASYHAPPALEAREEELYHVTKMEDWLYVIDQMYALKMYLVIGSEKALLIDTGYGFMDYRPMIREITDKPVIVVNTHGDIDHVIGNYLFDEVYISVHDFRDLPVGDIRSVRSMMFEQYPAYFKIEKYTTFDQWMEHSVMDTKYHLIDDGYVFNLGDRKIEVIAVPGHTAGSIALLDRTSGYLFSGDMINATCVVLMDLETRQCDPIHVSLYSFRKLMKRLDEIKLVCPCHCVEPFSPDIIPKTAQMLAETLENKYQDAEQPNYIGQTSRTYWNEKLGVGVNYVTHAAEQYPFDAVIHD